MAMNAGGPVRVVFGAGHGIRSRSEGVGLPEIETIWDEGSSMLKNIPER